MSDYLCNTIIKAEGLTKRFGSLTAVKNLSLEVREGEIFGFLGPNGAGKTTTILMICGLIKPDAGRVILQGQTVTDNANLRARLGFCPQEVVLWERLTCLEQLQFVGEMYGLRGQEARRCGKRLLEELDLIEKQNQPARTLSGGMQHRLNLALALVHDPEIVMLDEPEAGLDPQSRVRVREYIRSLARQNGNKKTHTIILTTHNMDEAERLADRVAIIDHGQLLILDTPEALKRSVGEGDVLEINLRGNDKDEGAGLTGNQEGLVRLALAHLTKRVDRPVNAHLDAGDGQLTLRALDVANLLPALLEAMSSAGLQTGQVRLRPNTLEDVFIQLTGRRLRE